MDVKQEVIPESFGFFGVTTHAQKKAVKRLFPLLKEIQNNNEKFCRLVLLWNELSKRKYESERKYELLYKIICFTNLILSLTPSLEQEDEASLIKDCDDNTAMNTLKPKQQFAVFITIRNIAAHWAHIFYEPDIADFVEEFLKIAEKGICCPNFILKLQQIGDESTASSGPEGLPTYLKAGTPEEIKGKINKLFCQTAYFLKKAEFFLEANDLHSACFALIAAGNCGRDFNRSKMNPKTKGSIMARLNAIRNEIAHIYENESFEQEAYNAVTRSRNEVRIILDTLKDEAANLALEYDIDTYFNSTEQLMDGSDSSPRPYEAERLNIFEGKL
ncbi:MAG: hypothetical protein SFW07_06540 [Gammaproteobacteria bacterium]|nr:hypothetical protein [Gammaproteobacteria bacterium]